MNYLLKERLQSIVKICLSIIEEDYEAQIERESRSDQKVIPFNPALWNLEPPQENKTQNRSEISAVIFNEKELKKLPKFFRTDYKHGRVKVRIKKRPDNRYEIRCQVKKIHIYASAGTVEETKKKFIERLAASFIAQPKPEKVMFCDYLLNWLEQAKRPYIKTSSYKYYLQIINHDIIPEFERRELASIKQSDIQHFLNRIVAGGKNRTAQKLYQTLNAVFEYAVADELITRSPMAKVVVVRYEEKHGESLTRQEEKQLVDALLQHPENINYQAFVFMVYTGLRRAELATVRMDDKFVHVITGKQRKGFKEKQRKIPISPMLQKVLPFIDVERITKIARNTLTGKFKLLMPKHHLHELRHTFITRCQECGIAREVVSCWAGHAADSSITSNVYTHMQQFEERHIAEIAKFIYDFA